MPITLVCGQCKAEYELKDDLAGKKLRCKECQAVLEVPQASHGEAGPGSFDDALPEAFRRDRFLVNQKKLALNRKYLVLDDSNRQLLTAVRPVHFFRSLGAVAAWLVFTAIGMGLAGAAGTLIENTDLKAVVVGLGVLISIIAGIVILVQLAPRRNVSFYTDEELKDPVLRITQDQKFSFLKAWYTVYGPDGEKLGRLMKHYVYNFFRKRWYIFDADGTSRLIAQEDSMILSILRRFLGGFFGLLRTNFIVVEPASRRVIGEFNRKYSIFDKYVLDMSADRRRELDRRMAVALAVMLDAGEHR